jgi:hypothetical protein
MAIIANARYTARASRAERLREIEGGEYESQQNFLGVAARIAKERRLSRFVYVSEKLS